MLGEVVEQAAHALLGQVILEQIIKDVAYKKFTAFEAKQWLEQKWKKRHDIDGTHEEQCLFLGIDPEELEAHFKEIDSFVSRETGDRAITLFMQEFEIQKENNNGSRDQ